MTMEQKYIDLINAEADGEISDAEKADLDHYLADNSEAQAFRDEIQSLCGTLNSVEAIDPPSHLKYAIMDNVKKPEVAEQQKSSSWLQILAMPIFRHAVAFAAGVFMTIALINSNSLSDRAFDDVTGMVGTISEDTAQHGGHFIDVKENDIAGTVSTHNSGSLSVVDFNLTTAGEVEIVADFSGRDLWFRGFAQLENDGATVSSEDGQVKMTMNGRNRYAMYLHHASNSDVEINLKFFASGNLIHETELMLRAPNEKVE
jgi:hypothetical protein